MRERVEKSELWKPKGRGSIAAMYYVMITHVSKMAAAAAPSSMSSWIQMCTFQPSRLHFPFSFFPYDEPKIDIR